MCVLELLDAVHALGLLGAEYEAAKRRFEFLATRPVGHASQARAIPIDLARLWVERALLSRLLFQLFNTSSSGNRLVCVRGSLFLLLCLPLRLYLCGNGFLLCFALKTGSGYILDCGQLFGFFGCDGEGC